MTPDEVPDGPLLLDTDVFSFLTWERGPWERFAPLVEGHAFVLSFATVGELRAGALKAFEEKRRKRLERRIRETPNSSGNGRGRVVVRQAACPVS